MSSKKAKSAPRKPRHVAIVAYGPSMHRFVSLAKAAGGRAAVCDEVWGINAIAAVLVCDRTFHMDDVRIQQIRADAGIVPNIRPMLDWLRTAPGPIYTSREHPDFPGLVEFPLERVLNATGGFPYLNSTPSYAIALAIAEGFDVISLWGLDYTYANRHDAEKGRACVEFWIGKAHERGIEVRTPDSSSLLDSCEPHALYGFGRFGSRDVELKLVDGKIAVAFHERPSLPSAEEIEAAYDHSAHPSPLVSGVTQPKETSA